MNLPSRFRSNQTTMPSALLNHLRTMFRATTSSRAVSLVDNYTYVNEDKISRSLICPICLDPLIDPHTHVTCENSFCSRCVKNLTLCPCCRASIVNRANMKMTGHGLRNILDELEVSESKCASRSSGAQVRQSKRINERERRTYEVEAIGNLHQVRFDL